MQGNVQSIEDLEKLHEAMLTLSERFSELAFDLRVEIDRALEWVSSEAPQYWRHQLQTAQRKLQEAQENLASLQATLGGRDKPPATETKKRVETLTNRVKLCEEKLRACKHSANLLQQESNKFRACITGLQQQAEGELPHAVNRLKTWIEVLREYATLRNPKSEAPNDNPS